MIYYKLYYKKHKRKRQKLKITIKRYGMIIILYIIDKKREIFYEAILIYYEYLCIGIFKE